MKPWLNLRSYRHCQNHSTRDTWRRNKSIHLHSRLITGEAKHTTKRKTGCLTLTGVYQSCHSIQLLLSQTLSLLLFSSPTTLSLSHRIARSEVILPANSFPLFFSAGGPAENCSLVDKKRSCRRRRGRATVPVAAATTPPPVHHHADSTSIVSSSVNAHRLSPAACSTNQPRWREGFTRFPLAEGLVHRLDDGWRWCSRFLVAFERQSEALRGSKLTYRFCEGLKWGEVGGLLWARLSTYTPNCLFHFEASRNVIARWHRRMPWSVAWSRN